MLLTDHHRLPSVLITSGGTRVPIDDVRWIGNQSTGGFGARIAEEFLRAGWYVNHLAAQDAILPFERRVSLQTEHATSLAITPAEQQAFQERYRLTTFRTFDQYAQAIRQLLTEQPNACCLAAAVADYGMSPSKGKIRSNERSITIELTRLPKLIDEVKTIAPKTFLVGFKLLSNVSEAELAKSAHDLLQRTNADLVVANDQKTVNRQHVIHLIDQSGPLKQIGPNESPAAGLVQEIIARVDINRANESGD